MAAASSAAHRVRPSTPALRAQSRWPATDATLPSVGFSPLRQAYPTRTIAQSARGSRRIGMGAPRLSTWARAGQTCSMNESALPAVRFATAEPPFAFLLTHVRLLPSAVTRKLGCGQTPLNQLCAHQLTPVLFTPQVQKRLAAGLLRISPSGRQRGTRHRLSPSFCCTIICDLN